MTAKNIALIALVVSALGILSETSLVQHSRILWIVSDLIMPLNLKWFSWRGHFYVFNVFNTLFYFLFLIGAIYFSATKGKEAKLIRFVFATILFSKFLFLLYAFLSILFSRTHSVGYYNSISFSIIYFFVTVCWVWLSYHVLIFFKRQRNLEIEINNNDNIITEMFVIAPTGKRFLNFLADYVMMILVFSPVLELLFNYGVISVGVLIRKFPNELSQGIIVSLMYIFCRILYYVSYEFVLGATPSKFLTGTWVTDENGNSPKFLTILVRTLIRFVPFEAFSFFSGLNGWHDKWSKTYVLKEKSINPLF